MPIIYFQTTTDQSNHSTFILKASKKISPSLADNLFRKKLYETPKKDIPGLIDYHYKRCDEPSEFADYVIELLEVALDEVKDIKYFKSLSDAECILCCKSVLYKFGVQMRYKIVLIIYKLSEAL